ncbi:MAG: tRNA pseudouridine(55) synthase TruB [Bacillota bacterium]
MDGLLNVLKPPGMSSHDVVNSIRRLVKGRKVGHTGTLDPGAAGVLLVCCGRAARLIEYLDHDKGYRAEITFGAVSSTGDSYGEISEREIPGDFTRDRVEGLLPSFLGTISQVPPMTSAVRHQGKKLYELARRGKVVDRPPRMVKIKSLKLARWYDGPGRPRAILDIECSAGTYIRTLCHDMGEKLGCGAYMSFLLRTRVGPYHVNDSFTLEELGGLAERGNLLQAVVDMERAVSFMTTVLVREEAVKSVSSGATLYPPGVKEGPEEIGRGELVAIKDGVGLLAVAEAFADESGRLCYRPLKVLR